MGTPGGRHDGDPGHRDASRLEGALGLTDRRTGRDHIVEEDDGYELRFQRGDPEGRPSQTMPLDTLVFRAFRLLVEWSSDP